MRKCPILHVVIIFASTLFFAKAGAATTYYWKGGTGTSWQTVSNWEVQTGTIFGVPIYGTSTKYPGQSATTDIADFTPLFSPTPTSVTVTGTIPNTIQQIIIGDYQTTTLTISSGFTITTKTLTIAQGNNSSFFGLITVFNVAGAGTLAVTTAATFSYDATLALTGNMSFAASATVTLNGQTGDAALLQLSGGILTANSTMFNLNGTSSEILVNSGTFNLTGVSGSTTAAQIYLGTTTSKLVNNGGAVNLTYGLVNCYDGPINNNSGTFTCVGSNIYLQDQNVTPSFSNAGTFNLNTTSTLYFYYTPITMTNTGTFNVASSIIDFGQSTTVPEINGTLNNTAGSFNFGASSIINFWSGGSKINNSGTGIFTCSSTSMINFAANNCVISHTSSNPFTLLSDASGSATIGGMNTGAYVGDAMNGTSKYNVQRYISAASRNYRLLSSAVNETSVSAGNTGAPDVIDISALGRTVTSPATYPGAYIGGPGSGFSNTLTNPIIYLYQESILPGSGYNSSFTSGKNVGIINITSASPYTVTTQSTAAAGTTAADNASDVKIPAGNGYLLYYIHDNTSTSTTSPLNACATTATGYINQGNIVVVMWGSTAAGFTTSLTLTTGIGARYPGVTMIGNPYPSTIDLNQVYTDNTGSAAALGSYGSGSAFYELNPSNEQFVSYNFNGTTALTSGVGVSRYISSGQGFYITVANAYQVFTFKEDQKTSASGTAPVFPPTILENIRLNPVATIDDVSHNTSKMTDAIIPISNSNTVTSKINDLSTINNSANVAASSAEIQQRLAKIKSDVSSGTYTDVKSIDYPQVKDRSASSQHAVPATHTPVIAAPIIPGLHLKLIQDSATYDECGIYFKKGWSDNFDNNDASDMDGVAGDVYLSSFTADDVRTSINSLGDYKSGKRVKLYVKFAANGTYQLAMEDIAGINTRKYSVFLIDNLLKDSLDLTLYKSYNFNYAAGTPNDSTRFILAVEHKPEPYYALLTLAGQKVTRGIQLNWTVKNEFAATKFVLQKLGANNNYVLLDSLQSDNSSIYSYVDSQPVSGNNIYRLQQTDSLGIVTYSAPITVGYNSASPNGGLDVYPNPAKTAITVTLNSGSLATQAATMDIFNDSGNLIEHKAINSNSFIHDVSSYQLGVYIVELKNSNGLLVGQSKFVKVE